MPTLFDRLAKHASTKAFWAISGFALGAAVFGADDIERLALRAGDQATALLDPPALLADDEASPHPPLLKNTRLAKLRAGSVRPGDPDSMGGHAQYFAGDFLAEGATPPKAWSLPYWVDTAGLPAQMPKPRALALLAKAAEAWAPCGARFSYQGARSKPAYGTYGPGEEPTDYQPVVGWMSLPEDISGLTLTEADPRTGQVERWSMDLDPARTKTASELLTTATHEFGHALGLEHGRDKRSIMFGGANPMVLRPSLEDLAECRRILSTWDTESASDMATPLAWDDSKLKNKPGGVPAAYPSAASTRAHPHSSRSANP